MPLPIKSPKQKVTSDGGIVENNPEELHPLFQDKDFHIKNHLNVTDEWLPKTAKKFMNDTKSYLDVKNKEPVTCLVQTGDLVDRGTFGKDLYDLFFWLTEVTEGRIVNCIGNHELMVFRCGFLFWEILLSGFNSIVWINTVLIAIGQGI